MSSLPILKTTSAPTTETLIRYFHQTQSHWSAHVAESTTLEIGTAWCNPQLNEVYIANRILDASLPAQVTAAMAIRQAEDHFASKGAKCLQWIMNPSSSAEQTAPLIQELLSRGFAEHGTDIMYLARLPASLPAGTKETIKIIPARASFRHIRALHEEAVARSNKSQFVEARMNHLDDPHYDALLAIKDNVPVATAGVLAMGEVGLVAQVFVSENHRNRGIGTTMIGRAMEICARSLFKHVLLDVVEGNPDAVRFYEKFGFRRIGRFVYYQAQDRP